MPGHFIDSVFIGLLDTGRNRFELVLQTRDPAIDSDLAWSDKKVLDSAVIGGAAGGFTVTPGLTPGGMFTTDAVPAATTRVVDTRAGRSVTLDATLRRNLGAIGSFCEKNGGHATAAE